MVTIIHLNLSMLATTSSNKATYHSQYRGSNKTIGIKKPAVMFPLQPAYKLSVYVVSSLNLIYLTNYFL